MMRYQVRVALGALGAALALMPAACGFGGDDDDAAEASDSTAFRTITVQIETTTTIPAVVVSGGGTVAPSGEQYEVQPGDYWIGIADKLDVGLNELLAVNNATTDTVIVPGQMIAVPAGASSLPPSEDGATGTSQPNDGSTGTYQIEAGDYWIKIAEDLDVPLQDLLNANNATTDTVLIPGEYLRVPRTSG
jgi:LysM repeat protein